MEEPLYKVFSHGPREISASVIPIELYTRIQNGKEILVELATAFLERAGQKKYIVTNWHCVTGRDPDTGQPRADDCVIPTFVRANFPCIIKNDGESELLIWDKVQIDFSVDGGNWIMHEKGQHVDIAAAPIPENVNIDAPCMIDTVKMFDPLLTCGDEVFILGFPKGIRPTGVLPIWKRASVASEPQIEAFGQECYLVDSATREGMSGSPVIGYVASHSSFPKLVGNGPLTKETILYAKPIISFLGVYSGRIGAKDALEAQIGKIWRPELVQQMLNKPRPLDWMNV